MKHLGRFIFGFFLIVFLLGTIFVFNVSSFASTEKLQENFKNLDLVTEVKKIKNSGNSSNQGELSKTINEIYDLAARLSIPSDFVDQIINSEAMKETLGIMAGSISDYVVNGISKPLLTEDEIDRIIDDNIDKWVIDSNVEMSETTKSRLVSGMKELVPTLISVMPTSEEIMESEYQEEVELIQLVFSNETKIILSVIDGILILLIVILGLKHNKWALNLGISFLITGFIAIIVSLFLPDMLITLLNQDAYSVAFMLLEFIAKPFIITGAVLLFISIILFIVYGVSLKNTSNV